MKRLSLLAFALFLASHCTWSQTPKKDGTETDIRGGQKQPQLQVTDLEQRLLNEAKVQGINTNSSPFLRALAEASAVIDPKTGKVEKEKLYKEQENIIKKNKGGRTGTVAGWNWYERGPNNVGGRTRAIMFDPNDAANSYKKVWAGSVGGGLWYNTDITNDATTWTRVNDFWDNLAVSCIASDPSNTQRFYVGTGEGWGNIDSAQGAGIFYSSNGGATWSRLASTIPAGTTLTNAFKFTQKIVVNSSGEVFAATQYGILKSIDQGGTWAFVMQPSTNTGITSLSLSGTDFVSDLEIGTDGILYAATRSGKVIKSSSSAGTVWTNITPAGVSASYRTEIGLAPSTNGTSQTLYVVSYSSTPWFKKSVDAGTNWTTVTDPATGISGQGWYDLIVTVHPTNPNAVYTAAVTNARSIDGGTTWPTSVSMHTDHHNIVFRPGSNDVVLAGDGGVHYSSTWGDGTNLAPTALSRNNGFNITQLYSVGIKNVNGDGYAISGAQDNGTNSLSSAYNTVGASNYVYHSDGMLSFIDQDEPNIQIASTQNLTYALANASGNVSSVILNLPYGDFINPTDYNDVANILYAKYTPNISGVFVSKIAKCINVGTTNTVDSTTITGLSGGISFIKVAKAANTVFLGTNSGNIYKVTGMNATTAAATLIGSVSGSISSIDVGATDNELLVTVPYYGYTSVYYTSTGGSPWTNKDMTAYGLPDVPVRYGTFFPYDTKKVVLGTELGVYYCPDITAAAPAWTDARASASGTNIGNIACYWLKFRKADGMLAVGTHGRGVYFSDFFKPLVPLAVNLTTTSFANTCPGGSIAVNFQTQGDFGTNTFTAQLSDASGSFASPTNLGVVTANTLTNVAIPGGTANGVGYKVRVVASGGTISNVSNAFAIQSIAFNGSSPALVTAHGKGGIVRLATSAATTVYYVVVPDGATAPSATQIGQGLNAANGTPVLAGSVVINAASTNRYLDITSLLSGQLYDLYLIPQTCSSATAVKIDLNTTGSGASYCSPTYSVSCATTAVVISRAKLLKGAITLFDNAGSGCSTGNYSSFNYLQATVQGNDALTFNTEHYYGQNLTIWVDYNRNGTFGNSATDPTGTEQVYISNLPIPPAAYPSGFHSGSFTIPAGTAPGPLRIRFRTQYYEHGQVTSPCLNYSYGETEDYVIWVTPTLTTSNPAFTTACAGANVSVPFTSTGTFNAGNVFTVQVAPATTGVFVNQTTTGTASPLTATLGAGLIAGEYLVRVMASNPALNGVTAINSFTINSLPSAAFTFTSSGLTANFTNTSTNATSYSWNFGDATTSTATSPSKIYSGGGTFTVALTATNACGSNTYSTSVAITAPPCPPTNTLSGTVSGGSTKYEVSNNIQSTQIINGTAQIKYDVGAYVVLNPGFIAQPSTTGFFTAYVDGCGGAYRVGVPEPAPADSSPKVILPVLPNNKQ